jgi:hypothetical protein
MTRRMMVFAIALAMSQAAPARAQQVQDPYLWLEDLTGEKSLAWVKERNARSFTRWPTLGPTSEYRSTVRSWDGLPGSYKDFSRNLSQLACCLE